MKQTNKVLLAILAVAMLFAFSVSKSEAQATDKDGNEYKTVKIGSQEWTAENLNVEHYRNGDVIPQVQDKEEWKKLTTGAWCYYNNDSANGKIYGKLYNWFAVNDPRGLVPEGWHVPRDAEWTKLTDNLGGEEVSGGKLKATTLWQRPNTGATNESGFAALPGGVRYGDGIFEAIGQYCGWSSSESYNSGVSWYRFLIYEYSGLAHSIGLKNNGLSIRCVRDNKSEIENMQNLIDIDKDTGKDINANKMPESLLKSIIKNDIGLLGRFPPNWKQMDTRQINVHQKEFTGVILFDTAVKKKEEALTMNIQHDPKSEYWSQFTFKNVFEQDSLRTIYSLDPKTEANQTYYRFYLSGKTDNVFVSAFVESTYFEKYKPDIERVVRSIRIQRQRK